MIVTSPNKTASLSSDEAAAPAADITEILASRTASLIEPGSRVLHVGCGSWPLLLELLKARDCRVTMMADDGVTIPDRDLACCERIVHGSLPQAKVRQQLGSERFDTVIAGDFLTRAEDPIGILRSVAPLLSGTGYIVAGVPNVAHGTVRLALLGGKFSPGITLPLGPSPRRFYTRETLEELLQGSGFVIGHVERIESVIDTSAISPSLRFPVDEVLALLTKDEDALTSYFLAVAFPLPAPQIIAFRDRVLALVRRCELAEQKLTKISKTVSNLEAEIDAYQTQVEIRDETIHTLRDRSARQQEVINALNGQVEQHRTNSADRQAAIDALNNQLEQYRTNLAERQAAVEVLNGELEQHRAGLAEHQVAVENLKAAIFQKSQNLEHKENQVSELMRQLDLLRGTISDQKRAIDQTNMETAQLERLIREREAALGHIYGSHGWKGLTVYYRMRDWVLPERSTRRELAKWWWIRFWRTLLFAHAKAMLVKVIIRYASSVFTRDKH